MAGPREVRAHGELLELASIEALGALEAADRAELAVHVRTGCSACLAALADGRRASALLAASAQPVAPSPGLRLRVLAPPAPRARPPRRRLVLRLALAAGAAALLLVATAAGQLWRDARARELGLATLLETIEAPATRVVSLAAGTEGGRASARAFVAADGGIALLVQGLPPPPPGRTYQLWVIEGGVPASAGTFSTGAEGGARRTLASAAPHGAGFVLAVTLEPAGGVPAPTGPIVLAQH